MKNKYSIRRKVGYYFGFDRVIKNFPNIKCEYHFELHHWLAMIGIEVAPIFFDRFLGNHLNELSVYLIYI